MSTLLLPPLPILPSLTQIDGLYIIQHPDDSILVRRELICKQFDQENQMRNPARNLEIKRYKEVCRSKGSSQSGIVEITLNDRLAFIRKNDLYFIAKVKTSRDSSIGYDQLWVMESLKTLIECIEESFGLDKLKENFYSVSLVLDLLFDYGLPFISSKPLLVAFLQQPAPGMHSFLNKAASLLTTQTIEPPSYSHIILNALRQNHMNSVGASQDSQQLLWRWTTTNTHQGSMSSSSSSNGNGNAFGSQSISEQLLKDVYVDIIEEIQAIIEQEKTVMIKVSGEVEVETRLPSNAMPRIGMRMKVGNGSAIEDIAVDHRCNVTSGGNGSEGEQLIMQIANQEYCQVAFTPPQAGKFKVLKYALKKASNINIPFDIKAKYGNPTNGLVNLELRFERFSSGRDKDGNKVYPQLEGISIKIFFPEEAKSASLTSMPDGTFSYDSNENFGEWTLLNLNSSSNDHVFKLVGSIKLGEGSNDFMPSGITAVVNMIIKNQTLSQNSIEKIVCSLNGTNKDDSSIFRGVKSSTIVKNFEYRF